MTPKEGRRAPDSAPRRDPFGMINGEGIITGTVVSAAASRADAADSDSGAA